MSGLTLHWLSLTHQHPFSMLVWVGQLDELVWSGATSGSIVCFGLVFTEVMIDTIRSGGHYFHKVLGFIRLLILCPC